MAVTSWNAEYHHLAFLDEVIGSQSSIAFSPALLSACKFLPLLLLVASMAMLDKLLVDHTQKMKEQTTLDKNKVKIPLTTTLRYLDFAVSHIYSSKFQ
jgi:hypothetical protein